MQWRPRGFGDDALQKLCKNIDPLPGSEASTPRGQYSTEECHDLSTNLNVMGQYPNKAIESDHEDEVPAPQTATYQSKGQDTKGEVKSQKTLCLSDILVQNSLVEQTRNNPPRFSENASAEQPKAPAVPPPPDGTKAKKELRLAPLFGTVKRQLARPISLMQCVVQEDDQQKQGRAPVTHMVSLGSVGHPLTCSEACKYVGKPRGCKDGASCDRCHLCKWNRYAPPKRLQRMLG
jgi:hypothetical protein